MIKAAPYSFAIVCVVVVASCLIGFHWHYTGKLTESDGRAAKWREDADYWKEVASRPKSSASERNPTPTQSPVKEHTIPRNSTTSAATSTKPSSAPPPVINAPGSNVIAGGTVNGNPTVNNFAPPSRHLSKQQADALERFTSTLPPDLSKELTIQSVNEAETQSYAGEIEEVFKKHTKIEANVGLSYTQVPRGIYVCVRSDSDSGMALAQKIADGLNSSGIPDLQFINCKNVGAGKVLVVIGVRPET